MDMECILPDSIYDEAKSLIKDNLYMKFYDETKPLYLETDASGIGLGPDLLQTKDGAACQMDIAPDNTIFGPITFTSKSPDQYGTKIQ